MKTKISLLLLITIVMISVLAGCSGEQYPIYTDTDSDEAPTITVDIEIMGIEKESDDSSSSVSESSMSEEDEEPGLIYRGKISVKSDNPTVYMATITALQESEVSYSETAGVLDDFDGIPSNEDEQWTLYINDTVVSQDALDKAIENEDELKWVFEPVK